MPGSTDSSGADAAEFVPLHHGGWPIYAARFELVVALLRRVRDEFLSASTKSPGDEDTLMEAARYVEWLADGLSAAADNCRTVAHAFSEPKAPRALETSMKLFDRRFSEFESPRPPGPLHAAHSWADDPGPLLKEAAAVLRRAAPSNGLPDRLDRLRIWTLPV